MMIDFKPKQKANWVKERNSAAYTREYRKIHTEKSTAPQKAHEHELTPIDQVLSCEAGDLPIVGEKLARHLDTLKEQHQFDLALDCLKMKVSRIEDADQSIREHNRVAVMEVLVRNKHQHGLEMLKDYLKQPYRRYHLYALPLAGFAGGTPFGNTSSVAADIANLFEQCVSNEADPVFAGRFTVEAFRAINRLCPTTLAIRMADHLLGVGDLELTAILDAVCSSTTHLEASSSAGVKLKEVLQTIYSQVVSSKLTEIGNKPGILGRLIEALTRLGVDIEDLMEELRSHPLGLRSLHQFAYRPIAHLSGRKRLRFYQYLVLGLMESGAEFSAINLLRDVVFKDQDADVRNTVRRIMLSGASRASRS